MLEDEPACLEERSLSAKAMAMLTQVCGEEVRDAQKSLEPVLPAHRPAHAYEYERAKQSVSEKREH